MELARLLGYYIQFEKKEEIPLNQALEHNHQCPSGLTDQSAICVILLILVI